MTNRRWMASVVVASALVLGLPTAALAHASFDVRQVPAGASEAFELRVPIETDSTNAFVDVLVPAGWTVDACVGAPGWSCETTGRDDGATVVNLATDDPEAGLAELFELAMTAPTEQGTYAFPVVQTYADGAESAWIGEPGGDRPAPRVQVGDDATPVERETALPTHGDGATDGGDEGGETGVVGTDDGSADDTDDAVGGDGDEVGQPAVTSPDEADEDADGDDTDDAVGDGGFPVLPVAIAGALGIGAALVASRRRG